MPDHEPRSRLVTVRLTESEGAALEQLADQRLVSVSTAARQVLVASGVLDRKGADR